MHVSQLLNKNQTNTKSNNKNNNDTDNDLFAWILINILQYETVEMFVEKYGQ